MAIENTTDYDDKVPTNLRIEPELKSALIHEAEELKMSMSDVINLILLERYEGKVVK